MESSRRRSIIISLLLAMATVLAYWPLYECGFVSYDDTAYVTENLHVQKGLTWEGLSWALQTGEMGSWHPITWLSHMIDYQLFGANPLGHHAMALLIHIANSILLFWVFRRMTKAFWQSALLGALFALHPLHVESVAWVSERKDVLSTFFALWSIWFYVGYAEKLKIPGAKAKVDYVFAFLFFILGLMSKPMIVTLPILLMFLDFWPLQRISGDGEVPLKSSILPLFFEKMPFLIMGFFLGALTLYSQDTAVISLDEIPFGLRLQNVSVSYLRYIWKTLWPHPLAIFYPFPKQFSPWLVVAGFLMVIGMSWFFFRQRRTRSFWLMGWLWFIFSILPVIGFVQTGEQCMADRYVYIPSIGLFIMVLWGVGEISSRVGKKVIGVISVIVLGACAVVTAEQVKIWKSSQTLFEHSIKVTENNYLAEYNLGVELAAEKKVGEAKDHFAKAVAIRPSYIHARSNLGLALFLLGKPNEAIAQYEAALRLSPNLPLVHCNLAEALASLDREDEAVGHFMTALNLDPNNFEAHNGYGALLAKQGKADDAIQHFAMAARLQPQNALAHLNLGRAFSALGQVDDALAEYSRAGQLDANNIDIQYGKAAELAKAGRYSEAMVEFTSILEKSPNSSEAHYQLAVASASLGDAKLAVEHYRTALRLRPDFAEALNNLAWILAANADPKIRNGEEAVRLAEQSCKLVGYRQPLFVGTLAAAYAEAGQFEKAVEMGEAAYQLATSAGQNEVAQRNLDLLKYYRANHPYWEPAASAPRPKSP